MNYGDTYNAKTQTLYRKLVAFYLKKKLLHSIFIDCGSDAPFGVLV